MKRLVVILAALVILSLGAQAAAAPQTAAAGVSLERLEVQCVVDETGRAQVNLSVELQVDEGVDTLLLPLDTGAAEYAVTGYRAKRVKDGEFVYLQLKDEAGFAGKRTFHISYQIPGAVERGEQGQTYTLSVISPLWQWGAQACSFAVAMPKSFTATPEFFSGYYGDVVEGNLEIACDGKTVTGSYTQPLMDHEALSMSLQVPEGYFTPHSSQVGTLVLDGLLLLCIAACVAYWFWRLRSGRLPVAARTLPPDGALAGELPYCFTCDPPDFGLMCMHWACLGYLSVYLGRSMQVVLRENMPMGNERKAYEAKLFTGLFSADPVCNGAGMRFGRSCRRAEQALTKFWRRRLFAKSGGNAFLLLLISAMGGLLVGMQIATGLAEGGLLRWALIVVFSVAGLVAGYQIPQLIHDGLYRRYKSGAVRAAAFLAMLVLAAAADKSRSAFLAMALFATVALAGLYGGKRSELGRESLAQIRGFRRFLAHASDHHLYLMLGRDPQYFYKLLPYAEAVGLGRSFAKKFGQIELEPCEYLTGYRPIGPTAMDFYEQFITALSQMRQARDRAAP